VFEKEGYYESARDTASHFFMKLDFICLNAVFEMHEFKQ